jgi:dual specificity phosphatase 12
MFRIRRTLATTPFIINHEQNQQRSARAPANVECAHVFLHPLKWMRPSLFPSSVQDGADPDADSTYDEYSADAPLSGRLTCPNSGCGANIGKFAWQGMQCSCGGWVVPAIGLAKARVDIASRTNLAARGPGGPPALGIRMPPGMRVPETNDPGSGRGNL